MEVSRAAQTGAGRRARRTVLARVMHHGDGKVVLALQLAQVRKQTGDLAGIVLVDPVQSHEGVEQEQSRPQSTHGCGQAHLVALAVEPKAWRGDDVDGERGEVEPTVARDGGQALANDRKSILGE